MTTLDELLRLHGKLTAVHVERWVARGVLRPRSEADAWVFEQVDVARVRLLAELADDIGLDEVRRALSTIRGSLSEAIINERNVR